MRTLKLSALIIACTATLLLTGCNKELEDCRIQNATLNRDRQRLNGEKETLELQIEQLKKQRDAASARGSIDADALQSHISALEEELERKKALVASMQGRLMGGGQLPVELSTMLEDFAKDQEKMVTYDSERGVLKFKSDLLFEAGSDTVAASAAAAIQSLAGILNSDQGTRFDVIIAGHTDDMRIGKPATRAKHPTNWHLSAHRAISVLKLMNKSNVASKRMSVRGFGEFRPIVPNRAGKKGNPLNRRVEIYIIPKGV